MEPPIPSSNTIMDLHPFVRETIHDKIFGTIIGSALGDAIGLYTEFLGKAQCESAYPTAKFSLADPATPLRIDGHRSRFQQRHWTDDTDHALLILLSYLHNGGEILPQDFAARLKVWVSQGLRALDTLPLGLGATVARVVRDRDFEGEPEGTAWKHWAATGHFNAANGSLMRIHPLGVVTVFMSEEEACEVAVRNNAVTHADPRCAVSCAVSVGLIRGILRGEVCGEEDVDALLERVVAWFEERQKERRRKMEEDDPRKEEPRLDVEELWKHLRVNTLSELQLDDSQKIGYCYKGLGSAILLLRLAMRKIKDSKSQLVDQLKIFEDLTTELIMEGGDADTNACIAGAVLGAYLGYKALPPHWRDGLRHGEWLIAKTESVCQLLGVSKGEYDPKKDTDTALDGGRGFLTDKEMERLWQEFTFRVLTEQQEFKKKEEAKKKPESGLKKLWNRV